jgi:uncharacterized protein YbjT (DUF2867 family)
LPGWLSSRSRSQSFISGDPHPCRPAKSQSRQNFTCYHKSRFLWIIKGIQGEAVLRVRQVAAELVSAGHEVVPAVRASSKKVGGQASVVCDFGRDTDEKIWRLRLEGIEAVVNCAGILRERSDDKFEKVHVETPAALFRACALSGIQRVIQMSALGSPDDGEFIASKYRGDDHLIKLDLDWTILRPSVVYSGRGSYGGTSLLRAMSALPIALLLPGDGQQAVAPISAEDLAHLVVHLLETGAAKRRILEVVGPETVTLENYLKTWRRWLRLSEPYVIRIPNSIVAIAAWAGEHFGNGPLGMTMYRMLTRGNTMQPGGRDELNRIPGWTAKPISQVLAEQPSFVQDRWHARLYFLVPSLRFVLGIVWIASAFVGFATPQAEIRTILANAGVTSGAVALVYFASLVDFLLGGLLLLGKYIVPVGTLMLISLLSYTSVIGIAMPAMWLEPFGGLLKNLALIPAVLVMMATADRK